MAGSPCSKVFTPITGSCRLWVNLNMARLSVKVPRPIALEGSPRLAGCSRASQESFCSRPDAPRPTEHSTPHSDGQAGFYDQGATKWPQPPGGEHRRLGISKAVEQLRQPLGVLAIVLILPPEDQPQ